MINNNYNRLVNSFSMLKIRSYDRMQLNHIHDLARLQIDSTTIYMHAGLFTCLFIVCSFFYLSFI